MENALFILVYAALLAAYPVTPDPMQRAHESTAAPGSQPAHSKQPDTCLPAQIAQKAQTIFDAPKHYACPINDANHELNKRV